MFNMRWSKLSYETTATGRGTIAPIRATYVRPPRLACGCRVRLCTTRSKSERQSKTSLTSQFQLIITPLVQEFPLLLWLALHHWPERFLPRWSRGLEFGFQSRRRLFGFGLQGFEAQDLTVRVALVQGFELINEGGGTVSFEALISEKW